MPRAFRKEKGKDTDRERYIERRKGIAQAGRAQVKAASTPKEKRRARSVTNMALSREDIETARRIPFAGSILANLLEGRHEQNEAAAIIFQGINEKGEIIAQDEKFKQAAVTYLKGNGKSVKGLVQAAVLVGVPELAAARLAVKGGKVATVAYKAYRAKRVYDLGRNANKVGRELKKASKDGIDWETAAAVTPFLLQYVVSPKLTGVGKHSEAHTAVVTARVLERASPKEVAQIIEAVEDEPDPDSHHQSISNFFGLLQPKPPAQAFQMAA